jgi:DNA polymerase III subunit epsilon
MDFIAIDVETANEDMASICQVGIAKYTAGKVVTEWVSLVDPEDYFSWLNVQVHGIAEEDVAGCPTFPEILDRLSSFLDGSVCVSHTHFDRVSIGRALVKYGLKELNPVWLDSARVARRAWQECAHRGYGLADVCMRIGYTFKHHDALEDAKAAGEVLLAAIQATGLDVDAWLRRVEQPIDARSGSHDWRITREGNPEGELYGEVVVFTGALEIPRRDVADLAAALGCEVASGVTKRTTLLVVGDQDLSKLAGKQKSSKHLKAEKLIAKGQKIRILKESDFQELARCSGRTPDSAR